MSFNSKIKLFLQNSLLLFSALLFSTTVDAFYLDNPAGFTEVKEAQFRTISVVANPIMFFEINGWENETNEEIDLGRNASADFYSPSEIYGGIGKKSNLFKAHQNLTVKTNIYILYGRIGAG